ncbi:unnamed protein product [Moneuplotes crassus]|uniref:Uncharacterized protein n=1 Tax=Euplotes crassus TaxID=5936 RepID=A0AAD1UEN3_EUPCR|nr:unnamed protein product [Moneuplotes crassus]
MMRQREKSQKNNLKYGILGQRVQPKNSLHKLESSVLAFENSNLDFKVGDRTETSPVNSRNVQILKLKGLNPERKRMNNSVEWSVRNHIQIPMKSILSHADPSQVKRSTGVKHKSRRKKFRRKIKQTYEINNELQYSSQKVIIFRLFRPLNFSS